MKKMVLAATFAALYNFPAQADTVGLYIGGQSWQSEPSGFFGEQNTLTDFNVKKEHQGHYFFAVEHPYPLLPNVRISSTTLNATGKTSSSQEINFIDPASLILHTSLIDTDVDSRSNVSYVDYTLYYELFDNGLFSFDLGLSARDFNGAITVTETITTVNNWHDIFDTPYTATRYDDSTRKITTDDIEPMLYIATNISLPLTGLRLFGQGDFLLIGDHTLSDYQVGLSYDLIDSRMIDFNLTLGYRAVKMEFEGLADLYTKLEFKGAFFGGVVHF